MAYDIYKTKCIDTIVFLLPVNKVANLCVNCAVYNFYFI